jgi:hypothetical protein
VPSDLGEKIGTVIGTQIAIIFAIACPLTSSITAIPIVICSLPLLAPVLVLYALSGVQDEMIFNLLIGAILIFVMFGLNVACLIWAFITAKSKKKVGYKFQCAICGYNWDWYIGNPLPTVTVQPNLIAKGELRIQEEQEEERKRQRDMEALYWLTHQKK